MAKTLSTYLGIATILLCSLRASSQESQEGNIRFTWGETYELPRHHKDLGFIGNKKDGYLQIGHDPRHDLSLQKFSPDLKLTSEKTVDLTDMPRSYSSERFIELGGKYYWIFSTSDRGEDQAKLLYIPVDLAAGTMNGAATDLVTTSRISSGWNIIYSPDKSKMLVEYRKKPEHRRDRINNDVIGFAVFDEHMNKLWDHEIRMPYTEKEMDNEDYTVDHDGNVYLLAKVYNEERTRKMPDYHFEILKWGKNSEVATIIHFKFTDKFVNSAVIAEDFNGRLVVAGYYSMKKRSQSADGAYLMRLNTAGTDLENIHKGTYEFPSSVLAEFESRRARRKIEKDDDAEAAHMQLKKIMVAEDGSVQLYGEEAYSVTTTYSNGRTSYTVTNYYYNDILAMNIGADGNMKWVKKIPKYQHGANGQGGMSFKQFSYNKNNYLFFLDNAKNLDIAKDEAPAVHTDGQGGILMVVKIDDDGNVTKKSIFDVRDEHKTLLVGEFDEVSDNQIITRAWGRKHQSQAALITFE
jgi:hypothetical protein